MPQCLLPPLSLVGVENPELQDDEGGNTEDGDHGEHKITLAGPPPPDKTDLCANDGAITQNDKVYRPAAPSYIKRHWERKSCPSRASMPWVVMSVP